MTPRISVDPKGTFIANGLGVTHNSIAESPSIQTSLEIAFAQFCLNLRADNPVAKADAFSKIEGARQFIDLWLNLGRLPEPEKEDPRQLKPLPTR